MQFHWHNRRVAAPWIQPAENGIIVVVWVVPGASRSEVVGPHGDALKVRVAAPPERGRATGEVQRLLSALLTPATVEVVSGASARTKRIRVSGIDPGEVEQRLAGGARQAW